MRQIVLDTETTGLSFSAGHRIVEIGCVEIINLIPTGKTFHSFLNPERTMEPGASKVSGITDDMLKDKPFFHNVVDDFLNFIDDSPLVIHNAPFDMSFLNGELGLIKKPLLPFERAIDTIKIARSKFPGSPANLDALCRRFDIDLSERTTHGALIDAKLLAEVYLQLSGGRQPDLILDQQKEKTIVQLAARKSTSVKEAKRLILSDAEKEKHEEFLKTIKNPLWKTG